MHMICKCIKCFQCDKALRITFSFLDCLTLATFFYGVFWFTSRSIFFWEDAVRRGKGKDTNKRTTKKVCFYHITEFSIVLQLLNVCFL